MSVLYYSLKFTKFSNYAPSFVSDLRDEMNRFVMGVLDKLKEEFVLSMLHDNMNIFFSWFILYQWKRHWLRERLEMFKRQGLLMVDLQKVSLTSKTSLF